MLLAMVSPKVSPEGTENPQDPPGAVVDCWKHERCSMLGIPALIHHLFTPEPAELSS